MQTRSAHAGRAAQWERPPTTENSTTVEGHECPVGGYDCGSFRSQTARWKGEDESGVPRGGRSHVRGPHTGGAALYRPARRHLRYGPAESRPPDTEIVETPSVREALHIARGQRARREQRSRLFQQPSNSVSCAHHAESTNRFLPKITAPARRQEHRPLVRTLIVFHDGTLTSNRARPLRPDTCAERRWVAVRAPRSTETHARRNRCRQSPSVRVRRRRRACA